MSELESTLNELAKRADDELEDCETDPEAVAILVVIILVVLFLICVGIYLWKRAKARQESRRLVWRDFMPSWLGFGKSEPQGPEMGFANYGTDLHRKGSFASDYSRSAFITPHSASFGPHSGYGYSGYQSQSSGYSDEKQPYVGESGYGSGYTGYSKKSLRRPPNTPLINPEYDDSYSVNSFEDSPKYGKRSGAATPIMSEPRTPHTPRTPRTPSNSRQRALAEAWSRARHGSNNSRGMDQIHEEEEEHSARRHHRSKSRRRH